MYSKTQINRKTETSEHHYKITGDKLSHGNKTAVSKPAKYVGSLLLT